MIFLGVNLTFFPLHFAGLHGFPRKYIDYPDMYSNWNVISSFGSILRVFALFLFLYTLLESFFVYRVLLIDYRINNGPEGILRGYIFGHSYQNEVYFSVS